MSAQAMTRAATAKPQRAHRELSPAQRIDVLETQAETCETGQATMRADLDDTNRRLEQLELDYTLLYSFMVELCERFGTQLPEGLTPPPPGRV